MKPTLSEEGQHILEATLAELHKKVTELEERIKKLESERIAAVAENYQKGSGRYL